MTDDIIRSWASEADNNIEKFINILTQNRMTALADKIEKERVHECPVGMIWPKCFPFIPFQQSRNFKNN